MSYRYQLIQYLIDKFELKSYLEIGVQRCQTFNVIKCEHKVGIDPSIAEDPSKGLFRRTSDEFFSTNLEKFGIVLIDGLHLYEQVIKDIVNSWNSATYGGYIVLHDCLPKCWEMCQRKVIIPEWTGDVWKAIIWFGDNYPELSFRVLDMDYGCGVIEVNSPVKLELSTEIKPFYDEINFGWFKNNLERMNVVKNYAGFNCD